jgi:hypothetical protein
MKKSKKIILIILAIILSIAAILLITFIPTFNLKTNDMLTFESDHFVIFYEKQDENVLKDISAKLNEGYNKISETAKISADYKTKVYIYKNIDELHVKKYGFLGLFFGPKWYIGDNVQNKVIIVSPNSPGPEHTYDSIVDATLHEYVHTLMWNINPNLSKFLNEGMAGYISGNTKPEYKLQTLPNFSDTKISNPITFGNTGMYQMSYTYIEYLDENYGMERTMQLISTGDYNKTFNRSEEEMFNEWIEFLKLNYFNM